MIHQTKFKSIQLMFAGV